MTPNSGHSWLVHREEDGERGEEAGCGERGMRGPRDEGSNGRGERGMSGDRDGRGEGGPLPLDFDLTRG